MPGYGSGVLEPEVSGIVSAVFGDRSSSQVGAWLDRHLCDHVGTAVEAITFQAGAVGAVFGLRLVDGNEVVLKAFRPGADFLRLATVVACQERLSGSRFGCAEVVDGPSSTEGVVAVVERQLQCSPAGSPHCPAARRAMAAGLAGQIGLLADVDGSALVRNRPAWSNWDRGAWPLPHDPIFDFSVPVRGYEWVDAAADRAAGVLRDLGGLRPTVGHSDWVWQNVRVHDGHLVAAYDWDSLVFAPESTIVGLAAGAFTQGSPDAPDAPTADEVLSFVSEYQTARDRVFDPPERAAAAAAATWVRCYNARCQLDNRERRSMDPPTGSFIDQLAVDLRV